MRFKYYLRGAGIGVITATLILSIAFLFYDNISDEEVIRRAMKLGMVMQETNAGTLADSPRSDASLADAENGTGSEGSTKTDTDPLAEPDQTGTDPSDADPSGNADDPSGDADDPSGSGADDPSGGDADPSGSADQTGQDGSAGSQGSGRSDGSSLENEEDGKQQSGGKTDEKEDPEGSKDNKKDKADSKPSGSKSDDDTDKPSDNKQDAQSDEVEIIVDSGDVSRMVSAKVFEAGLVDDAAEFNDYLGANDYDNMLQPGTYKIKKGSSFQEIARILTRQ